MSERSFNPRMTDDSEENRSLVEIYLKGTPHVLEVAEDGEEAVAMTTAKEYDSVLMDIQMPVRDGYTATRVVRARERELGLVPTPILALTAHALDDDVEKSLAAGCNAHLSKPIKKAELLKAIVDYAERA